MADDNQNPLSRTTVTAGEMLLVINDIHQRALAARRNGDDGAIMLEIEQLADDILERSCNEGVATNDRSTA